MKPEERAAQATFTILESMMRQTGVFADVAPAFIAAAIRDHVASLQPDEARLRDLPGRLRKNGIGARPGEVNALDVEYLLDLVAFQAALIRDLREESSAYNRGVEDGVEWGRDVGTPVPNPNRVMEEPS